MIACAHDNQTTICGLSDLSAWPQQCSNLTEHLDDVSHDVITDYLSNERHTVRGLWELVEGLIKDKPEAFMLVDDSVILFSPMNHDDHVDLLRPADIFPGASFADLGAGSGAFTLALRELLGLSANIYAVDRDRNRLTFLEQAYRARFGSVKNLQLVPGDFTRALDLPPLDGILMANSLHFLRDKERTLRHVGSFLKPGGVLLLIEYNVDQGNPWVPHPLSFETFCEIALRVGFSAPRLLAKKTSSFLHEFYSAETYADQ